MTVASTDPILPEENTVVWRYMNAAKFAGMLQPFADHAAWRMAAPAAEQGQPAGQLWFGYPWSFNDPFEGKLPKISRQRKRYIEKVIKHKGLKKKEAAALRDLYLSASNEHLYDAIEATADLYGASCWHMNDDIDPKMWRFSGRHTKKAVKKWSGSEIDGWTGQASITLCPEPPRRCPTRRVPGWLCKPRCLLHSERWCQRHPLACSE